MNTGRLIAEHRKVDNLTQEQLAEEIHTSRQTIAMWETGRQLPSDNVAILAARVLRIDEETLLAQLSDDRLHQQIDHLQRAYDVTLTIGKDREKQTTQEPPQKLEQTNDGVTLTITRICKSIYWDYAHEALPGNIYTPNLYPPMRHSDSNLFLHLLIENRNKHLDLNGAPRDTDEDSGNTVSGRRPDVASLSSVNYYIEDEFGNRPGTNLWPSESDENGNSGGHGEIIRCDYPRQGTKFHFHRDFVNHHQDDCDAILFEDIPIDEKGITKEFKNAVIRYNGIRESSLSGGNDIHLVHSDPLEVRYIGIRQVIDNLGNTYAPCIRGHYHPRQSDLGGYLEYFSLKELNPNATTISFKYFFARTILSFEFSDLPLP